MINLEQKHKKIVLDILNKYPYSFYAFGSRTKNKAKPLSDLDLCFTEDIPIRVLSQIATDFEESDLPFKIDLLSWNDCSKEFKDIISTDLVCIKTNTVDRAF
ncbi:MAG: hypothetical protein RLZZ59_432 [Pseudomonadota bacterium]